MVKQPTFFFKSQFLEVQGLPPGNCEGHMWNGKNCDSNVNFEDLQQLTHAGIKGIYHLSDKHFRNVREDYEWSASVD